MAMAMRRLLIGLSTLLGASSYAVAGDVYKTVDAQGQVTYSDHALSPASKKVTLDVIEGNPQEAARLAKALAAENADAAQQAKDAQEQAAEQQRQQAQRQQQEKKCAAAREQYATFAAGGRIWHMDEQGNRVYYSDEELDSLRSTAKAAVDAACTS
jgi:hypothetical protein